ncbi:ribosome small subunit-dependent GTPase A [Mycoplasmoides alvi]|uniref:ribosome small subunit-dependent GTPase A n=1 Tax=Mycoplasmoides alvi TaxID=78580 RepID=UPI000698436A|nr:ribosome small subunit-dependent GTPase A [Mycoplasmoides alvi]
MKAIVLKIVANLVVVWHENKEIKVFAPGKWKQMGIKIYPGDYVQLDYRGSELQIIDLYPRKNLIEKLRIANIDNLIVVQSIVEPNINWLSLLKTIAFYEYHANIIPIFLITKTDIAKISVNDQMFLNDLKQIGYVVLIKNKEKDLITLQNIVASKISCFTGESGVGKSTLINNLDPKFMRSVQEISWKLNRGKNTTTQTELLSFHNGFLVDTPGYSKFLLNLTPHQLSESFHDFSKLKTKCKFNDCLHLNEFNCAIIKILGSALMPQWRYNIYVELQKQLKFT